MSKESVVEIPDGSGNFYRYEYVDGETKYRGPVGDAPPLNEEEFLRLTTGHKPGGKPNYIHQLEDEIIRNQEDARELNQEMIDLWVYLNSDKFKSPGELRGYVNVSDVLHRLPRVNYFGVEPRPKAEIRDNPKTGMFELWAPQSMASGEFQKDFKKVKEAIGPGGWDVDIEEWSDWKRVRLDWSYDTRPWPDNKEVRIGWFTSGQLEEYEQQAIKEFSTFMVTELE